MTTFISGLLLMLLSVWGCAFFVEVFPSWTWQHTPIIWSAAILFVVGLLMAVGALLPSTDSDQTKSPKGGQHG